MQTGNRWEGNTHPGDLTRKRQQALLKAKADREAAAVNIAEVQEWAHRAGYDAGWIDGADFVLDKFRETGLDVDAVLSLADDAKD
jgi:hypothetical protein